MNERFGFPYLLQVILKFVDILSSPSRTLGELPAGDTSAPMSNRLYILPALAIIGLSLSPFYPSNPQTIEAQTTQPSMTAIQTATATAEPEVVTEYVPDPTPTPTPEPQATPLQVRQTVQHGSKHDWMAAAGIPQSEWHYVDFIVSRESGWNPNAVNLSSGACGLAQFLPCSHAKAGANWNDPVNALSRQYRYVLDRYGSYRAAVAFWQTNRWY